MELVVQVFPGVPPLEGLECLRGAPPLEVLPVKQGWVAFAAWGAHSQNCSPGDLSALCVCFLVPVLVESRAVTEVGEGLQQLRRPRWFWLSNVGGGAAVVVSAIQPAAGAAVF